MGWREFQAFLGAMNRALTKQPNNPDSWAHADQLRRMQAARDRAREQDR